MMKKSVMVVPQTPKFAGTIMDETHAWNSARMVTLTEFLARLKHESDELDLKVLSFQIRAEREPDLCAHELAHIKALQAVYQASKQSVYAEIGEISMMKA
jgi:hypothetical protein